MSIADGKNVIESSNNNAKSKQLVITSKCIIVKESIWLKMSVPKADDFDESANFYDNPTYECISDFHFGEEENVKSVDEELDCPSQREIIRKSIQLPERCPKNKPRIWTSFVSKTDYSEENSNCHINPAYESTLNINQNVELRSRTDDQEYDSISYREMIRRSIQLPERRPKRKKCCHCKLLHKDHKEERLFIAYALLYVLFVMTFGSIGISVAIRTLPVKFFPDCWRLAVTLAFLTFLIDMLGRRYS